MITNWSHTFARPRPRPTTGLLARYTLFKAQAHLTSESTNLFMAQSGNLPPPWKSLMANLFRTIPLGEESNHQACIFHQIIQYLWGLKIEELWGGKMKKKMKTMKIKWFFALLGTIQLKCNEFNKKRPSFAPQLELNSQKKYVAWLLITGTTPNSWFPTGGTQTPLELSQNVKKRSKKATTSIVSTSLESQKKTQK